jgi:predicted XRE-type DNA-binding protein
MTKLPREYVLIPKEEYEALTKARRTEPVDAIAYGRASLAQDLLAARKAADLTQTELAKRLGISQSLVSQAEQGKVKVGERYVASVLKACGLPSHWSPKPVHRRVKALITKHTTTVAPFALSPKKARSPFVVKRAKRSAHRA